MRLTDNERNSIRNVIYKLDPDAKIWLFGSRVNDRAKGGDIDLLIMSSQLTVIDKLKIRLALYDEIGEQKIDLIIAADDTDPFTRIALSEGEPL